MQPADLGLPARFESFRRGQADMALDLACAEKRFTLLSAPTGCGKSIVYVAAALAQGARTLVLTSTKGLQEQLLRDFAEIGMRDVRGQSNFRCVALDKDGLLADFGSPGTTCDEGPCHVGVHCGHKREGGCGYYDAIREARDAQIVVTNYAYWMTIQRHSDPETLGAFELLVLDEAHAAPDLLANFCSVKLDPYEVRDLIGMTLPPIDEGIPVWAAWAKDAHGECKKRYRKERPKLNKLGAPKGVLTKRLRRIESLGRDLRELSKASEWKRGEPTSPDAWVPGMQVDWVAEKAPRGALRFTPVWAHAYSEDVLFARIKRVILSSATLQKSTAHYLGIAPKHFDFLEFDSTFDPAQRPLYYVPTVRVDHRMDAGAKRDWVSRIDEVISTRLDRKGIVHTRSYARAQELMRGSKYASVMFTHANSRTTAATVREFRRAKPPAVLVSPSMEEGRDFPYDECRFQIIAKVPFGDGRQPLAKARRKSDPAHEKSEVALSIIQQTGRGMRAEDDWCETFIIDDHWEWFSRSNKRFFPRWFQRSWIRRNTVPEATDLGTTRRD